jgi:hypothetical protein
MIVSRAGCARARITDGSVSLAPVAVGAVGDTSVTLE